MSRARLSIPWSNRHGCTSLTFWMSVLVCNLLFYIAICPLSHQNALSWIHRSKFFPFFAEDKTGCSIEDVLVFFSGTNRVPPLNFDKQPTITFLHSACAKFATASTCDLQLRLPTGYGEDYEAFKSAMVMAVKDNDGFGGV